MRALVILSLLVAAAPASADEVAEAKAHYQKGAAHYNKGDWAAAIDEFEQAYQHSKRPAILFNIARAEAQRGDDEKAISYMRRYLAEAPNASDAPAVRAEIEAREKTIAGKKEQARLTAEARRIEEEKQKIAVEKAKAEADAKAAQAARLAAEQDADAARKSAVRPRWPGIALLTVGGLSLVGGIVLGVLASGYKTTLQARASAHNDFTVDDQSDESRYAKFQPAGIALDVVGVAFLGAGAGLLAWALRSPKAEPARAWISPTLSGLMAGGVF